METIKFLPLLPISFLAAFVGANTGGGGFISLIGLLWLGYPLPVAIATNRLAFVGGFIAGGYRFHRSKMIYWSLAIRTGLVSVLGAIIGGYIVIYLPQHLLQRGVGGLMIAMLPFVLMSTRTSKSIAQKRLVGWWHGIGYGSFFGIGLLGTMLGAAGGIFSSYIYALFFRLNALQSAGTRLIQGLFTTGAGVLFFSWYGTIHWQAGAIMLVGMMLGAYTGACVGIRQGIVWIDRLLVIMVVLSALKMLFF